MNVARISYSSCNSVRFCHSIMRLQVSPWQLFANQRLWAFTFCRTVGGWRFLCEQSWPLAASWYKVWDSSLELYFPVSCHNVLFCMKYNPPIFTLEGTLTSGQGKRGPLTYSESIGESTFASGKSRLMEYYTSPRLLWYIFASWFHQKAWDESFLWLVGGFQKMVHLVHPVCAKLELLSNCLHWFLTKHWTCMLNIIGEV